MSDPKETTVSVKVSTMSQVTNRADSIVSMTAKASVYAHMAYIADSDQGSNENLATLRSRLVQVRGFTTDLIEQITGLLGDKKESDAPRHEEEPVATTRVVTTSESSQEPPTQSASNAVSLEAYDKLMVVCQVLGETTNAQVQTWMKVDPNGARDLINKMVTEGWLIKASSKLYKHKTPSKPNTVIDRLSDYDKLKTVCEMLGETTNAQVQTWMKVDANAARDLINKMVTESWLVKAGSKLYKHKDNKS